MSPASAVEQAWTAIAVAGLIFSAWLASDGWLDLAAVRAAVNADPPRARSWGPRWWVALSAVIANGLLCLVWLGFASIGAVAMSLPPNPLAAQTTAVTATGWVLIAMEAILAFVQGWHLFVRGRVSRAAGVRP